MSDNEPQVRTESPGERRPEGEAPRTRFGGGAPRERDGGGGRGPGGGSRGPRRGGGGGRFGGRRKVCGFCVDAVPPSPNSHAQVTAELRRSTPVKVTSSGSVPDRGVAVKSASGPVAGGTVTVM